jgi:serine/threonine protein phosphatase PrpC
MSERPDVPKRKPEDDEIDVFGLTHAGKVRPENQDHFLVCALRRQVDVRMTSLPESEILPVSAERLGTLAMVADGVGGGKGGEEASRLAVSTVTKYVSESIHSYYAENVPGDGSFTGSLYAAALRVHADLLEAGEADPKRDGMATTLTLFIGVWPYIYLLQVGDSRHYVLQGDELHQTTRDQTVAQALADSGAMEQTTAAKSRWASVLSSSIGGSESTPVVSRIDSEWNDVHMLCSDGLTKHVSDERIRTRLRDMVSAEKVCEELLQDALDGGGTDNITVIVGRVVARSTG